MRILILALLLTAGPLWADDPTQEVMEKTGLTALPSAEGEVPVFGKTHRGYPLRLQIAAGDVWGRFFARLAMSQASEQLPSTWRLLFFDRPGAGDIAGSRADKWLSELMGYPLVLTVVLEHDLEPERLIIRSNRSVFEADETLPKQGWIGHQAGEVCSQDADFASRVLEDEQLMERLRRLRNPLIVVDRGQTVLLWAGDELEYSEMIRDHESYGQMFLSFFDTLVDLTEKAQPD